MKKYFSILVISVTLLIPMHLLADEGMWLPLLLQRNEADMKKNGMKISADDIYNVNHASLKDAVLLFGNGCTAEFISSEGLVLTNHHCGYSQIVSHSSVENDYLTNGFWAMSREEELPCPGLTVTRLVYMEDVTTKILDGVTDAMTELQRAEIIEKNTKKLTQETEKGTHYKVRIKPLYYGNQYFMYVNEVFGDVRLVGAPPSNIGKFGGDTDNWMWPRHTGDFSMFRVYVNEKNEPAEYSKTNRPYKPLKHLTISLKGTKENDFTFVFGYPGTTQQFLTSDAVNEVVNITDPARIKLRTKRLNVYNEAMNQTPAQRLRYASQVAGIANGWKKWQGEILGIKRMDGIQMKEDFEQKFQTWATSNSRNKEKYGGLLSTFRKIHAQKLDAQLAYLYFTEAVLAADVMNRVRQYEKLIQFSKGSASKEILAVESDKLKQEAAKYFGNDYGNHRKVDKQIFKETMKIFYEDFGVRSYPFLMEQVRVKFGGDVDKYLDYVFENSFLTSQKATERLLNGYKAKHVKKIEKDPAVLLFFSIFGRLRTQDIATIVQNENKLDSLYRVYVQGIMEMQPEHNFHPDANLTLRVTYGKVKGFSPMNGVNYNTHTTIEGIMQKENPDIYDYVVEQRLKDLYVMKDYGDYADENGTLPVCFIASNHTTGGNSGSPVLNGDGELVGINFDRNWEGTMSDLIYDPDRCRNISLDIRYCLFIIDKFAGAHRLIEEMTINK